MTPIITELDEETGEWEIVADPDDEDATLDTLIAAKLKAEEPKE